MPIEETVREAHMLFQRFVTDTGFTPPDTCDELALFVEFSRAPLAVCDGPEDFEGIQIGDWIYIANSPRLTDRQRMRILAHEWCHFLRRKNAGGTCHRLYTSEGVAEFRDLEEQIASAFERLF